MPTILRHVALPAFAVVVALLTLMSSSLYAQSPQVERIDIYDAGIYCAETVQKVRDPDAPTGHRNVVANMKLIRRTSQIPAQLGTRFGMRYAIVGTPNGAPVDLRLITRLPSPGLRDPDTGKATLLNEYPMAAFVGSDGYREYHLEYDWEIVPGVWAFELWEKDRKLAEQRFMLLKLKPGEKKQSTPCAPVVSSVIDTITAARN